MLSNRLMLTRTERTEMFRTERLELSARSRRPRLTNGSANHRNGSRAALLREHNDTGPTEDPDDSIDPDDSGPRLSVTLKEPVDEIYALPAAQTEQTSGRDPHTLEQSTAPESPPIAPAETAGAPAPRDLLDPAVLRTMPPRVAAFMLREPPPWRQQERLLRLTIRVAG
jgi:hypothetical protein